MTRQSLSQMIAVFFALLLVVSAVGGYAFAGTALAASSTGQQDSITSPTEPAQTGKTQSAGQQNSLGTSNIQPAVSTAPVTVNTTLQDISIEKFKVRKVSGGQYEILGVVNGTPSEPIAPVGHPVTIELRVYETTSPGRTLVAQDQKSILLEPGSIRPHKINVSGTIYNLNRTHDPSAVSPTEMYFQSFDHDGDGDTERVVVSSNSSPVLQPDGTVIIGDSNDTVETIRDPYTADFSFNLELGKNKTYDYELDINAVDGPDTTGIRTGSISVTNAVDSTSVSSYFRVLKNERYRSGSDITFVTTYKSTLQQSQKDVYETLALPTRGEYRPTPLIPHGEVKGFAHASSTNGEFARFLPSNEDVIRITTSTQSVSANQPQTLVIRYVAPGTGNMTVIPIDSSGIPIRAGPSSGKSHEELGYKLPRDPTTVDYVTGANNRTNLAVIQLSKAEQQQLNQQGELFLSYEAKTSDSFRLYCQAVLTGTVDRDIDACGFNTSSVDNFSNGVIQNTTITPVYSNFTGQVSPKKKQVYGIRPDLPDRVTLNVTVRNSGTTTIRNEPVNIFKNKEVTYNKNDSTGASGLDISVGETITRTLTLDSKYQGEDVYLTTDLNTGDGTLIVNVTNDDGQTKSFVYDGHKGEIKERLDGMSASDSWTVSITSEMYTGQQEPSVSSIFLEGKTVGDAGSLTPKEVTLQPGETTTVSWTDVPITTLAKDQKTTYTAHFFDMTESVYATSNVSECNRSQQVNSCSNPKAIIDGPIEISMEPSGSEIVRTGTQTVESTTCPDASTETCPASSDWNLVKQDVGYASGTQQMRTQESGVPLNISLVGTGAYSGSMEPLNRAGINNPYRNLPGDNSSWSVVSYGIIDTTGSQSKKATKAQMANQYGSIDEAYEAGWTIETRQVRTEATSVEYAYFRALDGSLKKRITGETMKIDRESDEWSRVTRKEYSYSNISKPLTKTRTVDVKTVIQHEDPDNETSFDTPGNWVINRSGVNTVVNRSKEAGIQEGYFYSDPGGAWEFNDSSWLPGDDGYRYTRYNISEKYKEHEWVLKQNRTYRLHKKTVTRDVHQWTRNFYKVGVTWERSLSGQLNQYEGPVYNEVTTYSPAHGRYTGDRSKPSALATSIVDYDWTVNGNPVKRNEQTYNFDTGTRTVLSSSASTSLTSGALDDYTRTETFDMSSIHSDDVKYEPNEINATFQVDDNNEGSIKLSVTNEYGITHTRTIHGEYIPNSGQIKINLGSMGFVRHSENYIIKMQGTSETGETVPAIQTVRLSGHANRGGDTISISDSATGTVTIGLTVTDSKGFTDSTTKTVRVYKCGGPIACGSSDPSLTLENHTEEVDYRNGLVSVQTTVTGLPGEDFYVVELTPGDIAISSSKTAKCSDTYQKMNATQIKIQWDSWAGLNESQVVSRNDPYCVMVNPIGTDEPALVLQSQEVDSNTIKRVVWEGTDTTGYKDTISFNINPRNNDIIDRGKVDFKLTLRRVGESTPADTEKFSTFFCDALNNNDEVVRKKAPENRTTRAEGGLICPDLNSDFDQFDNNSSTPYDGQPALDGIDACPYDPSRQEFLVSYGPNKNYCSKQIPNGEIGVSFDTFDNPKSASKHMVYYDRYKSVGVANVSESYSNDTLMLGYSTKNESTFAQNHLVAYYPLSEKPFVGNMDDVNTIPQTVGETTTIASTDVSVASGHYDIKRYIESDGDKVVVPVETVPAWELAQTDRNNIDSTYPYKNIWMAVDLSGNNYHAPLMHRKVLTNVDIEDGGATISHFPQYRGDLAKTVDRGLNGPYGSGGYAFTGQTYIVPSAGISERFQENFAGNGAYDYGNCDTSKCWKVQKVDRNRPLGGEGWNKQLGRTLSEGTISSGDEGYTVSMYVKPGPNTGNKPHRDFAQPVHLNRTSFYTMHSWNGYLDKRLATDTYVFKQHSFFATGSFYKAGLRYNTFNFYTRGGQGDTYYVYGVVDHGTHAWPDLPSMVEEKENEILFPTYTGSEWVTGFSMEDKIRYQKLAMSQGWKTISTPPEMRSIRATDHTNIRDYGSTGAGTGWRHIAITADSGGQITYYVDGLPYKGTLTYGHTSRGHDGAAADTSDDGTYGGLYDRYREDAPYMNFIIGADMNTGQVDRFLQDWHMSEYRIYDYPMTGEQVRDNLVIDTARYVSRTEKITENEKISVTTADGQTRQERINELRETASVENLTISLEATLNGGEVQVRAYPLYSNGSRINNPNSTSEYQRVLVKYNETQQVCNMALFFDGDATACEDTEDFNTSENETLPKWIDGEQLNKSLGYDLGTEDLTYENSMCDNNYHGKWTACYDSSDRPKLDRAYYGYRHAIPTFVAKDIMYALDNGTISLSAAYRIAEEYDENQYYVYKKRELWQSSLYFSGGEETTLEDMGITSKADFKRAIQYDKKITYEFNNTVAPTGDDPLYNKWEVEVMLKSRPHTHEGPVVKSVSVGTNLNSSEIGECNEDIYRC